jgi:transcriptional regulator with XRE-family HTH domain
MNQVTVNASLRLLLQTARQARGLTQKEAALRAGIDQSWWKKLESGRRTQTQAGTLAAMAYAAGVSPGDLDKVGRGDVADRLRLLLTRDQLPSLDSDIAEDHLARTPGTTAREREELILLLREMRSLRHGIRSVLHRNAEEDADPFDREFLSDEK